jgi:ABC-type lipoprotein export system ATPase subunit
MTLTVVIGSSGSGKTTFLNHVHKSHNCTYIRQYHNIRPYVIVSKIPHFEPKGLPYWDIYEREEKAASIRVGGTMAGEFTAGLSGGQRKLLLFELIFQRFQKQTDLLLVLDEPFAGVTDDFVPFIVKRLNDLRENHNILLVTNDHVETLKSMADNTITVSAIDRTTVNINNQEKVDRELAILALGVGESYNYETSMEDIKFFMDVEVFSNMALAGIIGFTTFAFGLFMASFWDSAEENAVYVLVAGGFISFFAVNPYLMALSDWRIYMSEEAEALMHSSKELNKFLKTIVTCLLVLMISTVQFFITMACIDGLESVSFWVAMLMDSFAATVGFICFGLYTELPFVIVQVVASLPFLLMIFFSTTFSPGAGVEGLKGLRYLFTRFYFWCMIPGVQDEMEGCPDTDGLNLALLCILAFIVVFVFLMVKLAMRLARSRGEQAASSKKEALMEAEGFLELQVELFGERARAMYESRHSSKHDSKHGSKHGKK